MNYYQATKKIDFEYVASLFNSDNNQYLIKKEMDGAQIMQSHLKSNKIKTFILTLENNTKIGWFTITKSKNKISGDFGMIIDKPYQNQSYGQKTMKIIEEEAKNMDIKKLKLEVFIENQAGIKTYQKAGFQENARLIKMSKDI